jgi:YfiH family protein
MFVSSEALGQAADINHGFFTRQGGVSTGIYASLNCGVGSSDNPALTLENRARVQKTLGAKALVTLYQIHSPTIVTVTSAWKRPGAPRADGMVTALPGIALGILTADCGPVLLADPERRIIGAAHAGWKGALGGICRNVTDAMCAIGAKRENIIAATGPSIAQKSYEVGPELRAAFTARSADFGQFFKPSERDGFFMFDLEGFVAAELEAAGVGRVDRLSRDTYAETDLFFSYRRTTHMDEPDYGRQISAIMLKD